VGVDLSGSHVTIDHAEAPPQQRLTVHASVCRHERSEEPRIS
jgi:hypothetical protein